VIEQAKAVGYDAAKSRAEAIIDIYRTGKQKNDMKWVENEIARRFKFCFAR